MSDSIAGCRLLACCVDLIIDTDQPIDKAISQTVPVAGLSRANSRMGLFTPGVDPAFGHRHPLQRAMHQSGANAGDGVVAGGLGLAVEDDHTSHVAGQFPGTNAGRGIFASGFNVAMGNDGIFYQPINLPAQGTDQSVVC